MFTDLEFFYSFLSMPLPLNKENLCLRARCLRFSATHEQVGKLLRTLLCIQYGHHRYMAQQKASGLDFLQEGRGSASEHSRSGQCYGLICIPVHRLNNNVCNHDKMPLVRCGFSILFDTLFKF